MTAPTVDNSEQSYGIIDVQELPPSKLMHNFTPFSYIDVIKLVKSLPSKSCELDPIPTNLLKGMLTEHEPLIAAVVNSSLDQGIFPSSLKVVLLRPLLKKINMDPIKKKYRPVSILVHFGKLIENLHQSKSYIRSLGMT